MLENGAVTDDGLKLGASLLSANVFRFRRFSTKVDIATAFDVDCSVIWKTSTISSATEANLLAPSEIYILVLLESMSNAYVISGDGNSKVSASITAPAYDYTKYAQHALIGNQLFIFGGSSDGTKIAVLEGCNFVQKTSRLLNDIDGGSAALSIDSNSRVLICFAFGYNMNHCEIFDGTSSTSTTSSNYGHGYGRLGLYQNQPITVGSFHSSDTRKVETLTNNGWSVIGDPPISGIYSNALVGLESGNLLMLGGISNGNKLDDVWLLSNDSWSRTGTLKSAVNGHSSLQINDSIFLFAGYGVSNNPLERVDMNGDEIESSEVIGYHMGGETFPVLFQVSAGFCA